MENASKALIFIASTLIAIMLLTFMVYMFRRFGITAENTEKRLSQNEIDKFNSKFAGYETGGDHLETDSFEVTIVGDEASSNNTKTLVYRNLFRDPSVNTVDDNPDLYRRALVAASQNLNKGSDVVSAINDAIDINYRNNFDYKVDELEVQNSVEIIVDLGGYTNDFVFSRFDKVNPASSHYRYLLIEPNKNVKAKKIYGLRNPSSLSTSGENTENKKNNANNLSNIFTEENEVSVYDMLKELRDTKVVQVDGKEYTIYKYYFFGQVFYNSDTNLVETVKFTLVKDNQVF